MRQGKRKNTIDLTRRGSSNALARSTIISGFTVPSPRALSLQAIVPYLTGRTPPPSPARVIEELVTHTRYIEPEHRQKFVWRIVCAHPCAYTCTKFGLKCSGSICLVRVLVHVQAPCLPNTPIQHSCLTSHETSFKA